MTTKRFVGKNVEGTPLRLTSRHRSGIFLESLRKYTRKQTAIADNLAWVPKKYKYKSLPLQLGQ